MHVNYSITHWTTRNISKIKFYHENYIYFKNTFYQWIHFQYLYMHVCIYDVLTSEYDVYYFFYCDSKYNKFTLVELV